METKPSLIQSFFRSLGETVSQRIVTGLMLALLGFMATTGKTMVKGVYAQGTREIMKPEIDTLQSQIDTLKTGTHELRVSVEQLKRMQLEMYSAQLQRDTGLQRILEERASNSRKSAEAKARTDKLLNDLTGGN